MSVAFPWYLYLYFCTVCLGVFVLLLSVSGKSVLLLALQKHAYSQILKISPPKTESFLDKNSDIFHISVQNIDCWYSLEPPRQGASNEYPQSMFLGEIRKTVYIPVNPSFTI